MTGSLEQLARQEQTLGSIRGIVRTMKALATINATPYEQAAVAIGAYEQTVRDGFAALAWSLELRGLAAVAPGAQRLVVAFGSDHGFCGNYNELVANVVRQTVGVDGARAGRVFCVGARLGATLEEGGIVPEHLLLPPASADGIGRLAAEVVTVIERAARGAPLTGLAVDLAWTRRVDDGSRAPTLAPLLPLEPALLRAPRRWPSRALPGYRMAPQALLAALVRNYLFARVFRASAEAMATENAARLALMQQAEQSVDERLDLVRREISGVRQDEITDELMDIVIGHVR